MGRLVEGGTFVAGNGSGDSQAETTQTRSLKTTANRIETNAHFSNLKCGDAELNAGPGARLSRRGVERFLMEAGLRSVKRRGIHKRQFHVSGAWLEAQWQPKKR